MKIFTCVSVIALRKPNHVNENVAAVSLYIGRNLPDGKFAHRYRVTGAEFKGGSNIKKIVENVASGELLNRAALRGPHLPPKIRVAIKRRNDRLSANFKSQLAPRRPSFGSFNGLRWSPRKEESHNTLLLA